MKAQGGIQVRMLRCLIATMMMLLLTTTAMAAIPNGPLQKKPEPLKPSLRVTSPIGGEHWTIGSPVKITWISTGVTGPLRIVLTQNGMDIGTIARPDAGDGEFEWNPGKLLPPDDQKLIEGAGYKIRIETLTKSVAAETPNAFAIARSASKIYLPNSADHLAALTAKKITVTYPKAGDAFNRIGTIDISHQYSANLKGSYIKLLLLKADEQPGPNSFIIQGKWSINSGRFHWNLPGPEEIELGSYRIRVQSLAHPDVYGDSGIFSFTAQEHSVTAGYTAQISNHEKIHRRAANGMTAVVWDASSQSNVPGSVRVGFRNLSHDDNQINYVYRSFVRFNLNNLKGTVKWAKLSYVKNDGTPDANRPTYALSLPWNGSASDLFSVPGKPINPLDAAQMRDLVQSWIDDPNMNFGLVMTGPDESMANNNAGHIMYLGDVRLEIGLTVID